MATLHIISIGGTGHKLAASCVHLAACGAFEGIIDGIRIACMDADNANGNLAEAIDVTSAYGKFYDVLRQASRLGLVEIKPATFIQLYHEDQKSLNETFKMGGFDADTGHLANFLYTKDEIKVKFDRGFYGRPSIGTLIIKNILGIDEDWKKFLSQISNGDVVFVFGSIFGGTGASAIPVVLGELFEKKHDLAKMRYAALLLTPYYNTFGAEEGNRLLDTTSFHLKAKASLYYYANQHQYKNVDALYVIGEPRGNFSIETFSEGGPSQLNKAHPVELFAATAAIDFIKNAPERQNHVIVTADREREKSPSGDYYYTWKMMERVDYFLPQTLTPH